MLIEIKLREALLERGIAHFERFREQGLEEIPSALEEQLTKKEIYDRLAKSMAEFEQKYEEIRAPEEIKVMEAWSASDSLLLLPKGL
jgi:hypothetical protein